MPIGKKPKFVFPHSIRYKAVLEKLEDMRRKSLFLSFLTLLIKGYTVKTTLHSVEALAFQGQDKNICVSDSTLQPGLYEVILQEMVLHTVLQSN